MPRLELASLKRARIRSNSFCKSGASLSGESFDAPGWSSSDESF